MWLMLQAEVPDDFVIATGETHTVREFLAIAAERAKLDLRDRIEIDPQYLRPTEVDLLIGDASKAHATLGWKPKVSFETLVHRMMDADLALAAAERRAHG
jgi:GDPmannose 4,6-dehydratase